MKNLINKEHLEIIDGNFNEIETKLNDFIKLTKKSILFLLSFQILFFVGLILLAIYVMRG
jgi:hypothetical protein